VIDLAALPFDAYLLARRAQVDEALERVLPRAAGRLAAIRDAMSYSLSAGGKRVRPILVLAAAEAAAPGNPGAVALAMPAACAVEMIHTYSLIHDDLPAMDNDVLRRGMPTLHVVYGEGLAILAGDGLVAEAFALMAREPDATGRPDVAGRKLAVIGRIAEAAGLTGMVGGQAIDLRAADRRPGDQPLDADGLQDMHTRKTGALIQAAAVSGAIMAGASDAVTAAIDRYAASLGLAFQIVDDVLDVEGTDVELGKSAGKDAASGKPTYPALFGLDESKRLARQAAESALAALSTAGLERSRLAAIIQWVVARRS